MASQDGGVPPWVIMRQVSSRESTDLEQNIILDTKNFIWLQNVQSYRNLKISKKVKNFWVSQDGNPYMVADHRDILMPGELE